MSIALTQGIPRVSGTQCRAQMIKVGVLIAELQMVLQNQNQSCSEKELRALDHQILHLGTILKVCLSLLCVNVCACVCTYSLDHLDIFLFSMNTHI